MINHQSQRGFTLLEVTIAAAIIALISGAVVALATYSIQMSILGSNRTAAYQLSQEGVELVRQIRDTTYINQLPDTWNQPAGGAKFSDCGLLCVISPDSTTGLPILATASVPESITLAAGSTNTNFSRSIVITNPKVIDSNSGVPADAMVKVECIVSWNQQGRKISVDSTTTLTDWRPVQ